MISVVVATDKNGVIGKDNRVPWRVRSDLKRLAGLCRGHPVILGRKTYESMVGYYDRSGRRMPGSVYIVLTTDPDYAPAREGARTARSMTEALEAAKATGDEDVLVIGGANVFREAFLVADRIYLTEVQTAVSGGDVFLPPLDRSRWQEVSREHRDKSENDEFASDLIVLARA